MVVPLFITVFAASYLSMSVTDAHNFSEPLSHVSALYFTITDLASVGFGDITPGSDVARFVVSLQMVLDLSLVVVLVRVLLMAVQVGTKRKASAQPAEEAPAVPGDAPPR